MCVAAPRTALSRTASSGPSTGTPPMRAPRLAGSSSSRPSTIQPCSWMPASSSRAASPAPITMARRISRSLPVMRRARVFVQHAVGDAHHAHAHQRHHRVQRQHRARHLAQAQPHHHGRGRPRRPARRPAVSRLTSPKPEKRHMLCGTLKASERQQVGRHHAEQHPAVVARPRADPALEAEAEQVGDVPARRRSPARRPAATAARGAGAAAPAPGPGGARRWAARRGHGRLSRARRRAPVGPPQQAQHRAPQHADVGPQRRALGVVGGLLQLAPAG